MHLPTKSDVRNSMVGGDITVYLPTMGHLKLALTHAQRVRQAVDYPFGGADLIRDPTNIEDRIFEQAIPFKAEMDDIFNQELQGEIK